MHPGQGVNLHVFPTTILGASRVFRQTKAVADTGLFDHVYIFGYSHEGTPAREQLDHDRTIVRLGSSSSRPDSALGRLAKQASWSRRVLKASNDLDVRVVNAHSVSVLPVCAAIARKQGAKLIYDTHELETEAIASRGLQRKIFKTTEKLLINRVSTTFVVNESIQAWYEAAYPGIRVTSIKNIPERHQGVTDLSQEAPNLREHFQVPSDARLYVHVGKLGDVRSVPLMVETFKALSNDHIVFLGDGTGEDLVDAAAASYPNIHRHAPIPPHLVTSAVASCDVGLCLIKPASLSDQLSLPNKALEYFYGGIPFFYSDLPEVDKLLASVDTSVWRLPNPETELLARIKSLTTADIELARSQIATAVAPSWDEEATKMVGEYRKLS